MAWSTPATAVSGTTLTAASWNASVRDNLLESAPAKATAAGQMFVSTGANTIAARTPTAATVATSQTTTSVSTYGNLATAGPAVTVTTGTRALVFIHAQIENSVGGGGGLMSFAVSGATTVAAPAGNALRLTSEVAAQRYAAGTHSWVTGLNAGSNTFTAKYTTPTGGTATFASRELLVLPF